LIKIYFLSLRSCVAFIFDEIDDNNEKTMSLMNFQIDASCRLNETIYSQIGDFRLKYERMEELSDEEMRTIKNEEFDDILPRVCEAKRDLAKSVTDTIRPLTNYCVKDSRLRRKICLNSLLMLQVKLNFICNMNERIFEAIYRGNVVASINRKMNELSKCRRKSFKTFLLSSVPEKLYWMQLINGNVCNFDFRAMLMCAREHLSDEAMETMAYLFDVIRKVSVCYVRKNVSETIEDDDSVVHSY
jgi:hypothetical protein